MGPGVLTLSITSLPAWNAQSVELSGLYQRIQLAVDSRQRYLFPTLEEVSMELLSGAKLIGLVEHLCYGGALLGHTWRHVDTPTGWISSVNCLGPSAPHRTIIPRRYTPPGMYTLGAKDRSPGSTLMRSILITGVVGVKRPLYRFTLKL